MLSLIAGTLVPALLGASLGSFQSAEILEKNRNVLGIAGQVLVREGDRDSLNFPAAEAWYRLGLGFGDFGVKLAQGTVRGSIKLPVPIGAEPLKLAIEPAAGVGEFLFEWRDTGFNTLTQSIEVSIPATFGDITAAPRAALTFRESHGTGDVSDSHDREWITGGTLTRRIKGEKVDWWGELGIYWGKDSSSTLDPTVKRSFLIFAPGIGASIEF